jgi:hypothetical protein
MRAVLAWNVVYTHFLHVYVPVSRNWASADSISTFVWDVFFASIMISTEGSEQRAADLAAASTITTLLSRTMSGMVPNYMLGQAGTYDRTEPQLGSWTVRVLTERLGAAYSWLPSLLLDALAGWSDWFYRSRRAEVGVLAPGGAGHRADAISLGSNAGSPPGLDTPHTLAAARYESGLDNSGQYDGDDGLCSGGICPASFNATSSLMNMYDVAFTSYFALDAAELGALAAANNRSDLLPTMQQRSQRASAVLNEQLWSSQLGLGGTFANLLLNGSFVDRLAPTVFSPLLTGTVPRARLGSLLGLLAAPEAFCVNSSHRGTGSGLSPDGAPSSLLLNFGAAGSPAGVLSCATDACIVEAVLGRFGVTPELQANVRAAAAGSGPGSAGALPLQRWSSSSGASALVTPQHAPANSSSASWRLQAAAEAFCYAQPPPGLQSRDSCALSLWLNSSSGFPAATCGTAACNASAAAAGLSLAAGSMCWAGCAESPAQRACAIALPSMARSDACFPEQTYWRGRAWAPQAFLVWLGLQRYANVPGAAAARQELASMASSAFLRQHQLFGQCNENLDGLTGLGSDSVRADSYYHWGALNAFLGILEAGGYPAELLAPPAPQGDLEI